MVAIPGPMSYAIQVFPRNREDSFQNPQKPEGCGVRTGRPIRRISTGDKGMEKEPTAIPPKDLEETITRDPQGRVRERKFTRQGKTEGTYASFYASGQPMVRMAFRNGIKEGEALSWYPDGTLREQGAFRKDKLEGEYRSYYENGQIHEEEYYRDGLLEGPYRFYYRNGQIRDEESFRGGKFDGPYRSHYKSGQLRESGCFLNDQRDGQYVAYDRQGRMREKALYRKGKLVGKFEIFTMDPAGEGAGHGSPIDEESDLREDREQAADNLLKNLRDIERK